MTPNESTEAAISRRDVLKNVGFAGAASTAFATVGAGAPGRCDVTWDAGTCVATTDKARIVESCEGGTLATVPPGTEARVRDWTCCAESTVYYYLEWCDEDIPIGWVPQPLLEETEECCTGCRFRWDEGACVATQREGTSVFEEPCTDEQVDALPADLKATVERRHCCQETGTVFYSLEWCDDDIPGFWVRQPDLRAAEGCCEGCEFRWDEGDCVATKRDGTPGYKRPCRRKRPSLFSGGMKAIVARRHCCEDTGEVYYFLEWCEDGMPPHWVRQADLEQSQGCCEPCDFRWEQGDCVATKFDGTPVFKRPCRREHDGVVPGGVKAVVKKRYCCEETEEAFYFLQWCDVNVPAHWVRQGDLVPSEGCCEPCDFRWKDGDCVATDREGTPVFEEPCVDEPVDELPIGLKAEVLRRHCCEETDEEFYLLEWCDPEIPTLWVRQADLRAAEGCCETCRFRWEEGACVATDVEGTLLFEEPCMDEPVHELPADLKAEVRRRYCCEETGEEFYFLEWCDPEIPALWVRQADLRAAEGCCQDR
jgi:hypothetical protein